MFEEVTRNFGAVIERVNAKFKTSFVPFVHTEDSVQKVFELVEEMDKKDQKKNAVTEATVARPSAIREALKAQREQKLNDFKVRPLLEEAQHVWDTVIGWK
ncbi:MAG TPA: hypothetical protein EYP25_13030 [Anaerolineae bacterium]|nr:hypothetical protein [Anaerolineae bacterium]